MGNNTNISIRDSIATKMLVAVLALYLLIATCVSIIHLWVEYRYQKENIIEDLGDIERAFTPGLAVNLWDLDENSLQASVEGMLKIPILVGVKISNNEQTLVAIGGIVKGHGKKGDVGFHINLSGLSDEEAAVHEAELYTFEMFERQFQISYNLDGKTIPLGGATIYSNSSVIYRSMKSQVTMLAINVFMTLLTFALALLWAVNHYLRKPLGILTDATAGISLNNLGSFSVDTKTSGHNEIKLLGEAMTAMTANLHEAISIREETEAFLRESEERFHRMFREHNAVMLLIEPESGEIVDANKAACKFYGYTREKLISLPIEKINTLPLHETKDVMQQAKENQKNYFEFKHRLASGEIRNVDVYPSAIVINNHPLLFSIVHDTTERKLAEDELTKYRDRLEVLVEEKTHELKKAQSELLQRERLATLGQVTATVSHELRNPLGTIKTALFSIDDSIERKEPHLATRSLELAERSIERCVNIIEELNSYTRVKGLAISEASIDDWLKVVIEEQAIPEGILCELNLSCDIRTSFDQEKLRQVMVNLIANGVHALQEEDSDGELLQISTRLLNGEYEIQVSDNGIGMSDETREKVFEPLFSTKGFGVGLGMVIVKSIVEQHHGEISIESKSGEGTTVSLRLPISPQES